MRVYSLLGVYTCMAMCCQGQETIYSHPRHNNLGRSFEIDYDHNQFLKDGQPYRYVSGSIHYFRVLASDWYDRLWKLRMAGFNAVQTVIEWSTHEPRQGEYHFSGNSDLEVFIKTAQLMGLDVILRIGPYICAERDMGGLPYWLLKLHPDIRLRSSDPAFLELMNHWLGEVLLPKIRPLLYENGGPVIMVQLENEYGCLVGLCDRHYTAHLRDLTREKLGPNVVLFTTDNPILSHLMKGKIPQVYATVDFGVGKNPSLMFFMQRVFEPRGPLVNSEYYPGWLDHWGQPHHTVDAQVLAEGLDAILALNASVNLFMFHGGTSFGLTSGSNLDNKKFRANPTSYDYDAPVSEAGDPTDKYVALRNVIAKYLPVPHGPLPGPTKKGVYGEVKMTPLASLWEVADGLPTIHNPWPLTFEQLDLSVGLVIYSSSVPFRIPDPARLSLPNVHDRGYVFIGREQAGTVSREQRLTDVAVRAREGDGITIVVESQGRISAGPHINDFKGITKNVTLNGHILEGWNMTAVDLTNTSILPSVPSHQQRTITPGTPSGGLTFYSGAFTVPDEDTQPLNTFLKLDGWTKGVAWVNNFCVGRYWPEVGPQVTLFVPWSVLKRGHNELLLLELESAPCPSPRPCTATLQDIHIINGPTPP